MRIFIEKTKSWNRGVYKWMMWRARGHGCKVKRTDAVNSERVGPAVGDHEEGEKALVRGKDGARGGAGQGRKGKDKAGHTVVCSTGAQRAQSEGTKYDRAVVQSTCGYVSAGQHPGGVATRGPVLGMHRGGGVGAVAGPDNDSMGVPDNDHAHYRRPGRVVRTSATTTQGSARGQGGAP